MRRIEDLIFRYFLGRWVDRKQFEGGRNVKVSKSFYVSISNLKRVNRSKT